ncbi:MAG: calcium/sodium antiporter [Candidatus Aminicenantes bacterium]|nr:calcium/sodium antiporter [Candidatus Aminicenantes bacterium]MDH5714032.1 calcium/sodium antiporter [Candidatus Aminicenantes bacterium]
MYQEVLLSILILAAGLALLVKGSDFFVKYAASIARKLGVSEFVIGLTLVAVGTSIPELITSMLASIKQQSDIAIGNVVGSNIVNIGFILGLAAALRSIRTRQEMLKRDGYIMLFAALLFFAFSFNRTISRTEAIIFIFLYFAYVMFLFSTKPKLKGKYKFADFIKHFFGFKYLIAAKSEKASNLNKVEKRRITVREERQTKQLSKVGLTKDLVILIISGFAVIFGAKYLVDEAIFFADFFNVPKSLIGISLVAVGTSLPELSVSVSAARKGYGDIAVGNIIGSNIANIFLILGASALIFPLSVIKSTLLLSTPFMIFESVLLLVFIKSQWEIRRIEGIIFIVLYSLFMIFMFFSNIVL